MEYFGEDCVEICYMIFFGEIVFDIWKPLGIRKIDQMESHNGHTVMLDDVAAGIYAAVVLGCINLWL